MTSSCADISTSFEEEVGVDGMALSEAQKVFEEAVVESAPKTKSGENPASLFLPVLDPGDIVPDWKSAKRSKASTGNFQSMDVEISTTYRSPCVNPSDIAF